MKEFFNTIELNDAELESVVGGYEINGANGYQVTGSVFNPNSVTVVPGSEEGSAPSGQSNTPSVTPQTSTQTSGSGSSSNPIANLLGGL